MTTKKNSFAPPQTADWLEAAIDDDAEAIRRRFLNREAVVRGIGWLYVCYRT